MDVWEESDIKRTKEAIKNKTYTTLKEFYEDLWKQEENSLTFGGARLYDARTLISHLSPEMRMEFLKLGDEYFYRYVTFPTKEESEVMDQKIIENKIRREKELWGTAYGKLTELGFTTESTLKR